MKYVYDMLEQLKAVSGDSGGPMLSYLLDMARMEAAGELTRRGAATSKKQRDPSV